MYIITPRYLTTMLNAGWEEVVSLVCSRLLRAVKPNSQANLNSSDDQIRIIVAEALKLGRVDVLRN